MHGPATFARRGSVAVLPVLVPLLLQLPTLVLACLPGVAHLELQLGQLGLALVALLL